MNRRNALSLIAAAFVAPAASVASESTDDTARRLDAIRRAQKMNVLLAAEDMHKLTGVYYKDNNMPLGMVRSITTIPVVAEDGTETIGIRTIVEFYEARQ